LDNKYKIIIILLNNGIRQESNRKKKGFSFFAFIIISSIQDYDFHFFFSSGIFLSLSHWKIYRKKNCTRRKCGKDYFFFLFFFQFFRSLSFYPHQHFQEKKNISITYFEAEKIKIFKQKKIQNIDKRMKEEKNYYGQKNI
jgi:hypothetical protein